MHMIGKLEVPQNDCAAAYRAVGADMCTAGNANTSGERRVHADAYVMANLHQIVQLHTVLDHRVLQSTTVDTGVGADFDIISDAYRAKLLYLLPATLVRRKAKAIGAYDRARVNDAARADRASFGQRHAGMKAATQAHLSVLADHTMLGNAHACSDHSARPYAGKGANRYIGRKLRQPVDEGRRVYAWRRLCAMVALPELGDACEIIVGIINNDAGAALRGCSFGGGRDHHTGCGRLGKLAAVFGMIKEGEITAARLLQRCQTLYR